MVEGLTRRVERPVDRGSDDEVILCAISMRRQLPKAAETFRPNTLSFS